MNKCASITEIKDLWQRIYQTGNSSFSFFQSYEWNECLEKRFIKRKSKTQLCYFYNDFLIAPVIIDDVNKSISILGSEETSDYLSFVFSCDYKHFFESFYQIFNPFLLDGYSLDFKKINEQSTMYDYLERTFEKLGVFITKQPNVCVHIPAYNSFIEYFNSLSKRNRQSYRTAINKIKRNNLSYRIEKTFTVLDKKKIDYLYKIYLKRRNYVNNHTWFSRALFSLKAAVKKLFFKEGIDCLSLFSNNSKICLFSVYIDNELAAFYEGVFSLDNSSLTIARVSTNTKYLYYSPGQIILIETMRDIIENHHDTVYLDLTRGAERYKYDFGGVEHFNYSYTISSNKN